MTNVLVYLALGANLGDAVYQLQQALKALKSSPFIYHLKSSRFYRTAPIEVESTQDFVNAVCCFETSLNINELFELTQSIEASLGKIPKPKTASRPIDIDLLFYGSQCYETDQLKIPHSHWTERLFVLCPLKELTQEIVIIKNNRIQVYNVDHLIQALTYKSDQAISLLEKNPFLP